MADRIDFNDLLKWSMQYQESYPTDTADSADRAEKLRPMSEEDRQFLLNAMDQNVMDEQKRVKILLRVLRLPEDPVALYRLHYINNEQDFTILKEKKTLRTLLEMRQEDEKRKKLGRDIIGREYIPSNYINDQEILKDRLLRESTTATTATTEDVASTNDNTNNTHIFTDEEIATRLKTLLDSIPPPTDQQLQKMYNKIREEKLDALEEIEDRTFRGDNAVGFVTFNGLPIVKHYLLSNDFEMASECFRLLGNIVSNQPFCQQKAIEYNLIPIAIEALNITRYIPYILADYQTIITQYQQQTDAQNAKVTSTVVKTIETFAAQFAANNDITKYQHYLSGKYYTKHIMALIKSALYFMISLCNNNSTAQTQFLQYNGVLALSYLFELGSLLSPQSKQYQTYIQTNNNNLITGPLFFAMITAQTNLFKQTIARVVQLFSLFVDTEYEITTSQEIIDKLMSLLDTYQHITQGTDAGYQSGEAIFNYQIDKQTNATPPTTTTEKNNNTTTDDQDEGKAREYFQEPIAPLKVEGGALHPAFKLKNYRRGGTVNQDGECIEDQLTIHPIMALFTTFAFPVNLWDVYLNQLSTTQPAIAKDSMKLFNLLSKVIQADPTIKKRYNTIITAEYQVASQQKNKNTPVNTYISQIFDKLKKTQTTKKDMEMVDTLKKIFSVSK